MEIDRRNLIVGSAAVASAAFIPGIAATNAITTSPLGKAAQISEVVRTRFLQNLHRALFHLGGSIISTEADLSFHRASADWKWCTREDTIAEYTQKGIDYEKEIVGGIIQEIFERKLYQALYKAEGAALIQFPILSPERPDQIGTILDRIAEQEDLDKSPPSSILATGGALKLLQSNEEFEPIFSSSQNFSTVGWLGKRKHRVVAHCYSRSYEPILVLQSGWCKARFNGLVKGQEGAAEEDTFSMSFQSDLETTINPSRVGRIDILTS